MVLAWHRNSRIEWYQITEYGIAWSEVTLMLQYYSSNSE